MKIEMQLSFASSFGVISDSFYRTHEGIIFDDKNQVDLLIYQKGLMRANIHTIGLLSMLSLDTYRGMSLVTYPGCIEKQLPGIIDDLYSPNYYGNKYAVFFKEFKSGSGIDCYGLKEDLHVEITQNCTCPWIDNKQIVIRSRETISSYSWAGTQCWTRALGDTGCSTGLRLIEYRNALILNAGDGKIQSLAKISGDIIWEQAFSSLIDSMLFIDEQLYVAVGREMYVIRPNDGLINGQFIVDKLDKNEKKTTLWFDGVFLYVIAEKSNRIFVYTQVGYQCVGEYNLPLHPQLRHGKVPIHHNGVNYLSLVAGDILLAGVEGGLLSWTADDIENEVELFIVDTPPISIVVASEKGGKESYYLLIPCDDIHDVIRFGETEARRIAALKGTQLWDNSETRNKKFNGEIVLMIEPSIGQENSPILDVLAKRTNHFCERMGMKSGSGRKPIKVSWEFNE